MFARKNYFYPDMPKDYQISQYDQPINVDGWLELPDGTRVGIERAHLEEDTGKSTHVGGGGRIHGAELLAGRLQPGRRAAARDRVAARPALGRARPGPTSSELRAILARHRRVRRQDGGGLAARRRQRVGPPRRATPFGTRCEIKNLNSLRSLGRAIEYEARRQIDLLEAGERGRPGDPPLGRGRRAAPAPVRSKEEADDYRYFPEPDLVPLEPDDEWIGAGRGGAAAAARRPRRERLADGRRRRAADAAVALVVERGLDELALAAIEAGADPARVLTHVEHNLAVEGAERARRRRRWRRSSTLETGGELTATQAKRCWPSMVGRPAATAEAIAAEPRASRRWTPATSPRLVDEVIAANPDEWERFASGDDKARAS